MSFSWRAKKKLTYFLLLFSIVFFIFGASTFFIYNKFYKGNCFDKKQNHGETGIDCGGQCGPCPYNLKDPIILWSRFFKESDGVASEGGGNSAYDLAALVENPNLNWGSKKIKYSFKLYKTDDTLILEKNGETFLNPKEKFMIFENSVDTYGVAPKRAVLNIINIDNWEYTEKSIPDFIITKKTFDKESSVLDIEIKNENSYDLENVRLYAELIDKNGNVYAVSSTKIDNIISNSKEKTFFTWQNKFDEEPAQIEIIPRVNIIKE